jgi:hypothetical protein
VDNRNVDAGNQTTAREPCLTIAQPKVCKAMAQQCGNSGHQSAPQKFVRLVGCRDPKARLEPSARPIPAPR